MIEIEFEGRRLQAQPGESLAAALTGHGIMTLRTTRNAAERGMFCGMGVCQECLVEIDGKPEQRACMTKIERPLSVHRAAHGRPLALTEPAAAREIVTEQPEVLVVGAGPGGLSAAIAARQAGASVLVVDERSQAGGQYFKQLGVEVSRNQAADRQHREGAALIETARGLGVEIRSNVLVWGAFDPDGYAAVADGRSYRFQPKATIIATGAYERGWPVPGWTLPGVMTTGAAQTLWRTARRLPGKRVLIAGNGPLNLQLAAELIEGGAEVVAVVEAAQRPGLGQVGALLAMAAASPGLMRDGLRYHARRRAGGAEMIHGMVIASIDQSADGLSVRLTGAQPSNRAQRAFDADVVCLGYGFEPSNELLRVLGCGHNFDPARGHLVTRRDDRGRTDVSGTYALGDCTGLGGARAALAEGALVGLAVAEDLGHKIDAKLAARRREAAAMLARHRRFQRALWRLYAAPAYSARLATPETLICRCEEITFGQVEAALAENMREVGAVKRRTRLGMGRCQGRYCAPVLEALMAERVGAPRGEFTGFAPRVPVKPVPIEELAQ
ncbi:MAG TPA: FAD-dependent oxidoreductase [Dongiaceae bacterium]|nr:FAD-dependent oxidoreductase [Dongiaceae bacterium]